MTLPNNIAEKITALSRCNMLAGCRKKRFIKDMKRKLDDGMLLTVTLNQAAYIEGLCWHFRRQMPKNLIPEKKP